MKSAMKYVRVWVYKSNEVNGINIVTMFKGIYGLLIFVRENSISIMKFNYESERCIYKEFVTAFDIIRAFFQIKNNHYIVLLLLFLHGRAFLVLITSMIYHNVMMFFLLTNLEID